LPSLDRSAKCTGEVEREEESVEREGLCTSKKKTHETKVALLPEVTDRGGRLSTGLEEVDCEDIDAPLSRLVDVLEYSNEEGGLRSRELLPGVVGRLAERKEGDGAVSTEVWLRSSLREYFGKEGSEEDLLSSSWADPRVDARVGRKGRSRPLRTEGEGSEDGSSAAGESRRGE
jgi:hypothetical protein